MFTALVLTVSFALPQDPSGEPAPEAVGQPVEVAPETSTKAGDFEREFARVLPGPAERAWRGVPWLSEFRRALVAASDADKPVLLWAMNGHPLGQT